MGRFGEFRRKCQCNTSVTHQQNGKDEGGTQLTFTTLASIAKYPCEAIAKKKGHINRKKFGFSKAKKRLFRHRKIYQNGGRKW